ncbi:MAG: NAD-dependent epimerase/dehydratase family protein [Janthinobacterium lividum]
MHILLIGGTQFLGRHVAAAALARGHEVTLFHRGHHPHPGTLGPVREILGDRHHDLHRLAGRRWDAVVDTCGYLPGAVRAAARALRPVVGQYVFISSVAAYADFSQPGYAEIAQLAALNPAQAAALAPAADLTASSLGDLYGALKAACEREVSQVFGANALLLRPGVLVGPHDPTDRLTYWLSRLARGGEVLAPGRPQRFVQLLDARDLAAWLIAMLEQGTGGAFNAASPPFSLTMEQLLTEAQALTHQQATLTWVSEGFLRREAVAEWSELPLYLAESGEDRGFLAADTDKALRHNLVTRSLADTMRDTLTWRRPDPAPLRAGLAAGRERELLRRWHATQPPGA